MDAGRHPLIDVVTNAEVVGAKGEPGNFKVRVWKHPRFVREDLCVACGLCVDSCPQVGGNEFDVGLKARKAIHRPFPQSVPAAYVIDQAFPSFALVGPRTIHETATTLPALGVELTPGEIAWLWGDDV